MSKGSDRTIELTRKVEQLGSRLGSPSTKRMATDLAEVYRAAVVFTKAFDQLVESESPSKEQAGKLLIEMQTWLYEEMTDHLEGLRAPLDAAVNEVYAKAPA